MYEHVISTPVGELRLCAREDAITGVYFPVHAGAPPRSDRDGGHLAVVREAVQQLRAYFAGELRAFDLPTSVGSTAHERAVWTALTAIPFAETRSYGGLAKMLDRPGAARAIGRANARNPLSIIVPCHRVIGASGALTGYAGGVPAKRWLLEHEARVGGAHEARAAQSLAGSFPSAVHSTP